jgi:NarL family two-component system response regulator LiaR
MKQIAVMIVDDHARVRHGLRTYLSTCSDLRVVADAANGEEALERCTEARPDVIVMDMMMPIMDGPTATGRIRELYPSCQVVALTSFVDPVMVKQALDAGAISYLLKDSSPETLVEAIREASQGRGVIDPSAARAATQERQEARCLSA